MEDDLALGRIVESHRKPTQRALDKTDVCPRCRRESGQITEPLRIAVSDGRLMRYPTFWDGLRHTIVASGIAGGGDEELRDGSWEAHICMACRRASVTRDGKLMFPADAPTMKAHDRMPKPVAELFNEATAVAPHSARAAAALARAALEKLLKTQYPDSKYRDLAGRVAEAEKHIPEDLYLTLTVLRVAGNEALHDGTISMLVDGSDDDLVPAMLGAVNDLVEELIERPERARRRYASLPEAKRAGAEARLEEVRARETPSTEAE